MAIKHISKIQDEGSFDDSFDDSLILRIKDNTTESGIGKETSLTFDETKEVISDVTNNRCWSKIGNVILKASPSPFDDQFHLKITDRKVSRHYKTTYKLDK